jgi:hypothetical protein
MALKGTSKDTPTLARELNVTHLVTGSVRTAGNALRVTAELVEATTDSPIWSEKLSGTMEDVFAIQEDISRQIVSALKVRLTDAEERDVAARPIENPIAHDYYLRAYQVMYDWTPQAQARALQSGGRGPSHRRRLGTVARDEGTAPMESGEPEPGPGGRGSHPRLRVRRTGACDRSEIVSRHLRAWIGGWGTRALRRSAHGPPRYPRPPAW